MHRCLLLLVSFGLSCSAMAQEATTTDTGKKMSEVLPVVKTVQDRYSEVKNKDYRILDHAQVGEKLTYQVRWQGIPAGTITMQVKRLKRIGDRKALSLEMQIETNDALSFFYPINSTITSLADSEDGRSYLFRRDLREGRRRVDDRLQFDYAHKAADGQMEMVSKYSKVKDGETRVNTPRPIPGAVQDSLSTIYYLRHLSFKRPGDAHNFLIGSRKRVDKVSVKAEAFERKEIGDLGTFDCVVVKPSGDSEADRTNIVSTKGEAYFYLEKNTGVPVFLSIGLPIGRASATLIGAEKTALLKHRVGAATPGAEEPEEE